MAFVPPPRPAPSRADEVPRLATFLQAQGIATLAWAALCIGATVLFAVTSSLRTYNDEDILAMVAYGVFAIGASITGVLQLMGASRLRRMRSRTFVLVSLWAGVASFPCGTIFCLPTGIMLVAYGMAVLLDASVIEAFDRRA